MSLLYDDPGLIFFKTFLLDNRVSKINDNREENIDFEPDFSKFFDKDL